MPKILNTHNPLNPFYRIRPYSCSKLYGLNGCRIFDRQNIILLKTLNYTTMFWWGLAILMAIAVVLLAVGGILYFVFYFLGELGQFILELLFDRD